MEKELFHRWDISPAEAIQIQNRLGRKLVIQLRQEKAVRQHRRTRA